MTKVSLKSKSAIMKHHKGHRKQKALAHMAVSPRHMSEHETDPEESVKGRSVKRSNEEEDKAANSSRSQRKRATPPISEKIFVLEQTPH